MRAQRPKGRPAGTATRVPRRRLARRHFVSQAGSRARSSATARQQSVRMRSRARRSWSFGTSAGFAPPARCAGCQARSQSRFGAGPELGPGCFADVRNDTFDFPMIEFPRRCAPGFEPISGVPASRCRTQLSFIAETMKKSVLEIVRRRGSQGRVRAGGDHHRARTGCHRRVETRQRRHYSAARKGLCHFFPSADRIRTGPEQCAFRRCERRNIPPPRQPSIRTGTGRPLCG